MSIQEDLRKELKDALRASDRRKADTVRMIETKVTERRTQAGFEGEVDDDLYREVIASYKKSLEKARPDYERGGERAADALAQLDWEIEFCERFLPAKLGDDDTRELVRAAIADTGASDPKMAGKVVGQVMKSHRDRVDAARVKAIAAEELGA